MTDLDLDKLEDLLETASKEPLDPATIRFLKALPVLLAEIKRLRRVEEAAEAVENCECLCLERGVPCAKNELWKALHPQPDEPKP